MFPPPLFYIIMLQNLLNISSNCLGYHWTLSFSLLLISSNSNAFLLNIFSPFPSTLFLSKANHYLLSMLKPDQYWHSFILVFIILQNIYYAWQVYIGWSRQNTQILVLLKLTRINLKSIETVHKIETVTFFIKHFVSRHHVCKWVNLKYPPYYLFNLMT